MHIGAEDTALERCPALAKSSTDSFDEGFGYGAGGRGIPRGTPALASVAVEGELTDDEQGPIATAIVKRSTPVEANAVVRTEKGEVPASQVVVVRG